jgi:hypothetical protein
MPLERVYREWQIQLIPEIDSIPVVPKVWGAPPWGGGGAQEILKGGARGVKLFYSLKINKKHKYKKKNLSITRWSF